MITSLQIDNLHHKLKIKIKKYNAIEKDALKRTQNMHCQKQIGGSCTY
jgi:hypothetical protein